MKKDVLKSQKHECMYNDSVSFFQEPILFFWGHSFLLPFRGRQIPSLGSHGQATGFAHFLWTVHLEIVIRFSTVQIASFTQNHPLSFVLMYTLTAGVKLQLSVTTKVFFFMGFFFATRSLAQLKRWILVQHPSCNQSKLLWSKLLERYQKRELQFFDTSCQWDDCSLDEIQGIQVAEA